MPTGWRSGRKSPDGLTCTYLSPAHRSVAAEIRDLMRQAGITADIDAVANVVGRHAADDPHAPALILASHYDTVRNAGKYDGRLGILAALVVAEHLRRLGRKLPFHLDVIAFSEEEGVRFSSSFLGSSAVAGRFDPSLLERRDAEGVTLAAAMGAAGLDRAGIPALARPGKELAGYLEVHIEQGPVLLEEELPVGIVTAIAGTVRCMVTISGTAGHAGTVPMGRRHDAAAAAAELVLYVEQRCAQAPTLVGTVGQLAVPNGAINIIPGRCELTLDIRAADDATRDAAVRDVMREIGRIAEQRGVVIESREVQRTAAVRCSPRLQSLLSDAVTRAGVEPRHLPSGAGHDAMMFDGVTDTAMLFVRCGNGGSQPFTARDHHRRGRRRRRARRPRYRPAIGTGIMTSTKAISDFVDREFARESAFLAELVKVPSDNPPGDCRAHAQRARELLEQLGLTVEAHEVPRSTVEAAGMKSVTNLIVRHRFGEGPVIALNAHGDVVPPGLGWRFDPYGAVVEDGPHGPVMYGRGVAVSKSDFATYTWTLLALKALAAGGDKLRRNARAPLHLRRGGRRHRRPEMAARREVDQARCRDRRRVLLCHRHRARRLPASRGDGHRQAGACRHAGDRRRRA